jgi:hypothetical protein
MMRMFDRMKLRLSRRLRFLRQWRAYRRWLRAGCPDPPPARYKQEVVRGHARRYSLKIMIETGTFLGDMIAATRGMFDGMYSIELSEQLHQRAVRAFEGDPGVTLMQGDSATVLPQLLERITRPCLFWLDAHYSGWVTSRGVCDTPIMQELTHILRHPVPGHVILIDDARHFTGSNGYPTLSELRDHAMQIRPDLACVVERDIIRLLPA